MSRLLHHAPVAFRGHSRTRLRPLARDRSAASEGARTRGRRRTGIPGKYRRSHCAQTYLNLCPLCPLCPPALNLRRNSQNTFPRPAAASDRSSRGHLQSSCAFPGTDQEPASRMGGRRQVQRHRMVPGRAPPLHRCQGGCGRHLNSGVMWPWLTLLLIVQPTLPCTNPPCSLFHHP